MGETKKTPKRTVRLETRLFDAFRSGMAIGTSCAVAGIHRSTYYRWRDEDPGFAERADAAIDYGVDVLEDVALQRATRQSDTLLMFLLKARRPDTYRETVRNEHTGDGGGPIRFVYEEYVAPSPDDA